MRSLVIVLGALVIAGAYIALAVGPKLLLSAMRVVWALGVAR